MAGPVAMHKPLVLRLDKTCMMLSFQQSRVSGNLL